ncbi:MAG: LLM class flavin-dependent oxidoreductase [Acidimicrobiales bacterium]
MRRRGVAGDELDGGIATRRRVAAIEAYGGPRRGPGESLDALEEAITVIRKIWSGERNLRFDGTYYRLAGAQAGPVPPHPIGIWLSAYGPKAISLTARVADGWVPSFRGDVQQIATMSRQLDDGLATAERSPRAVRRILNASGSITTGATIGVFNGPVGQWIDNLTEFSLSYAFDTFVFWGEGEQQLDLFAQEVVPAARARLAAPHS